MLFKQGIVQVPNRMIKINVKNFATKFLQRYIVKYFETKWDLSKQVNKSHLRAAFLGYAYVTTLAAVVRVLTNAREVGGSCLNNVYDHS